MLLSRLLGWRWTDSVAGGIGAVLVVTLGLQVTARSLRYLNSGRVRDAAAECLENPLAESLQSRLTRSQRGSVARASFLP